MERKIERGREIYIDETKKARTTPFLSSCPVKVEDVWDEENWNKKRTTIQKAKRACIIEW